MGTELFIADAAELDPYPSANADVWRLEECFRRFGNEHRLHSGRGGYPYRDMSVIVVVVRKHRKYFFADEESRFAMRKFFGALRHRKADFSDAW